MPKRPKSLSAERRSELEEELRERESDLRNAEQALTVARDRFASAIAVESSLRESCAALRTELRLPMPNRQYSCVCKYCDRDYDDLTQEEVAVLRVGGPCPSDDCPRRGVDWVSLLPTIITP